MPPDTAFALIEKVRGALRLMALSAQAAALGLTVGMTLADARARVPDLAAIAYDPRSDQALLARLARACLAYTPGVAAHPPATIMLDMAGCLHLYANARALDDQLQACCAVFGVRPRMAFAATPDMAAALAEFGGTDWRALPVAALRLGPETHLALQRAGFTTLGMLASRPRAPLAARFGVRLIDQLDRLTGAQDAHITPARPRAPITASLRCADPIARTSDVLEAIERLAEDICRQLERAEAGGRAFLLQLDRSDGHVAKLRVDTSLPTRDPATIMRLVQLRLDSLADPLDPGFGYDRLVLTAIMHEPLAMLQRDFDPQPHDSTASAALIDRLRTRFGAHRILRLAEADSHIPECAGFLSANDLGTEVRPGAATPCDAPSPVPLRPLSLFDPPQPITVIAEVPDGPPRRFEWRGRQHSVMRHEGPERIAFPWWQRSGGHAQNPGLTRDYYRVEDTEGHRFWLFRHGLYGTEAATPRWYIHGLFA